MSRTVLITGATGKIGQVLVRHFLEAGDCVIATARSEDKIRQFSNELGRTASEKLHIVVVDLLEEHAASSLVSELQNRRLTPDCAVNNARNLTFLRLGEDGMVSRRDFLNELTLDVIAPYELVMALATMPDSRLRAVVNIGSQYGLVAPNLRLYDDPAQDSPLHYGVAKAGLAHLTKELAVRLAHRNIRVNCVAFGGVDGRVDEAFKQRYSKLCPMGRMLTQDELAGPVDMLLSEYASGITGHVMVVDGGWTAW